MIYKYFVCGLKKSFNKDETKDDGIINGIVELKYPIGDNESLLAVEHMIVDVIKRKEKDAKDVKVILTSFQLISTNPC